MTRPVVVDLFAGAGGMSLGFEQAGFDVAAAVELDPVHAAVHAFNFPKSAVLARSVVGLSGEEIRTAAGLRDRRVDVVVGGAPCQGFSLKSRALALRTSSQLGSGSFDVQREDRTLGHLSPQVRCNRPRRSRTD